MARAEPLKASSAKTVSQIHPSRRCRLPDGDAEAGRNYFVEQYIRMGLFVGGANLRLVDEAEGKKSVLECQLATHQ